MYDTSSQLMPLQIIIHLKSCEGIGNTGFDPVLLSFMYLFCTALRGGS